MGSESTITGCEAEQARSPFHQRRCAALAAAVAAGAFSDDTPSAMLMDLDHIRSTIRHLQHDAGFPATALHTVAVKANPVGRLLEVFKDAGMGAEAASLGELAQALEVGFDPDRVVFDSPAKTTSELRFALERGVRMNLDNFQELERVAALLRERPELAAPGRGLKLGLRINPQVGGGTIAALSTGAAVSKFGIPLGEARAELVAAFGAHGWLNMLHLHVGSQGVPLERVADGVRAVWGLLREIEAAWGPGRVRVLDIGGGMPVDFGSDEPAHPTPFQQLASLLAAAVPGLFQPGAGVQLVTENGRSLVAKAGCVASRVEYTKTSGGRAIAVAHVGADLLMRACYLPDTWALRLFVCDACGRSRETAPDAEWVEQDVAGPLCFQGDRLATARRLPRARPGDFVVAVDCGAYALSMYSRYNSRCSPPVYGYSSSGGAGAGALPAAGSGMALKLLRAGDTLEGVLSFWNQL